MSLYTLKELNNKPADIIRALILEGYRITPIEQPNSKLEDKSENLSVITLDAINDWAKHEFTNLNKCNDFINGVYPYAYDDPKREEILDDLQSDLVNEYGCDEDEVYTSRSMIDMKLSGTVQRILDKDK